MSQSHGATAKDGVSAELDLLSSDLMGVALDRLADGVDVNVLLVVQDREGCTASYEFAEDGIEECLSGAHEKIPMLVRQDGDPDLGLAAPVRYAIVYEGAIADDEGVYQDCVLLEFGERGYRSYSAFSLVENRGEGDAFRWSDPAPAGELQSLL
ncbi:hypothetical protein [Olsenella urininfantis]|uniref:hypothetical protein n=1 Tax=Olsenella urininfantis TaxID=1871033 RepID=UPI000986599F|nr:hypothetical protein [Olsenella urininfantis]